MHPDDLLPWIDDPRRRPVVVGVVNVTPDSFSDGGRFDRPCDAAGHVRRLIDDGADWIDVGGESTRPGSDPVAPDEQIRRVLPAVSAGADAGVVVSIDTTRAAVARAAAAAGARVVNDVSAGTDDPEMPGVLRQVGVAVLMHMQGRPKTMQQAPAYGDVVAEVESFLLEKAAALPGTRVLLDPGIGFGKTLEHNLSLLRATRRLASHGHPLLIGTSRKRFLGELTPVRDARDRDPATGATVAWCVREGASAVRVHDVRHARQVVDVTLALGRESVG